MADMGENEARTATGTDAGAGTGGGMEDGDRISESSSSASTAGEVENPLVEQQDNEDGMDIEELEGEIDENQLILNFKKTAEWDRSFTESHFERDEDLEHFDSRENILKKGPQSVLLRVFEFLDGPSLLCCSQTCQAWRNMLTEPEDYKDCGEIMEDGNTKKDKVQDGELEEQEEPIAVKFWRRAYVAQWNKDAAAIHRRTTPNLTWKDRFLERFSQFVKYSRQMCATCNFTMPFRSHPSTVASCGDICMVLHKMPAPTSRGGDKKLEDCAVVWNTRSGNILWQHQPFPSEFQLSEGYVVAKQDQEFQLWTLRDGKNVANFQADGRRYQMKFDGKRLFAEARGPPRLVYLEIEKALRLRHTHWETHPLNVIEPLRCIETRGDEVACAFQRIVVLYNIKEKRILHRFNASNVSAICFDDDRVVTAHQVGMVDVWSRHEERLIRRFRSHNTRIDHMKMSSWLLVTTSHGERIRLNNIHSFHAITSLLLVPRPVHSIEILENGSIQCGFMESQFAGVRVWDFSDKMVSAEATVLVLRSGDRKPMEYRVLQHRMTLFAKEFNRGPKDSMSLSRVRDATVFQNETYQVHMLFSSGQEGVNVLADDIIRYLDIRFPVSSPHIGGSVVLYALKRASSFDNFEICDCTMDVWREVFPVWRSSAYQEHLSRVSRGLISHEYMFPSFAIHNAIISCDIELVRFLLVNGANPNAQEHSWGFTPLHMVVTQKESLLSEFMAQLLFEHHADHTIMDYLGRCPRVKDGIIPMRDVSLTLPEFPLPPRPPDLQPTIPLVSPDSIALLHPHEIDPTVHVSVVQRGERGRTRGRGRGRRGRGRGRGKGK
eukprot:TRINITY_DN27363_c0_g1_i1.p1 TRINITY_DN27363_c0_g1~~TRINITY_DN27363_c0_g1_i1.p1  ORF type:complete len:886 (-),score=188.80 TRINITY_DN27363_c0_g1_i1:183-2678(-)